VLTDPELAKIQSRDQQLREGDRKQIKLVSGYDSADEVGALGDEM